MRHFHCWNTPPFPPEAARGSEKSLRQKYRVPKEEEEWEKAIVPLLFLRMKNKFPFSLFCMNVMLPSNCFKKSFG